MVLFIKSLIGSIFNLIYSHLTDITLITGMTSISIGSFMLSVTIGFYITGAMLVLLSVALMRFGGD